MTTYNASVDIHVGEHPSSDEIHDLEQEISKTKGITSACVNEKTPHLWIIDYDPRKTGSSNLLHHIKQDS